MKSFRGHISLLLLSAFSFFIVPQDLLHELCGHEDTRDIVCTDACLHHLSKPHQHCEVLQLTTPPFHQALNNFSFASFELLCIVSVESTRPYHYSCSPFLFFRGPPSVS